MSVTEGEEGGKRKIAPKKDWKSIIRDSIIPTLIDPIRKKTEFNLRKMFYILVVKLAIGNTIADYTTLSDKTKIARMNGVLPIDCFVDEVRQTFDNGYKDDDEFESEDDYIKRAIDYLRNAPDNYVKTLPTWYGQKHYVEEWLEKAAGYRTLIAHLGNRHVRVTLDRGNTSLSAMVENVRRLRKIAREESGKEIHIKYSGDMDPSGDDMDRDLMERILSVNAKINVDEFLEANFKSGKTGEEVLADYTKEDPRLEQLYEEMEACPREDDKRDKETGVLLIGRNTILDRIRIRKSEIITNYHPEQFPHLVPMTKEQEEVWQSQLGQTRALAKYAARRKRWKIVHFERIAITGDQIRDLQLPEMPTDQNTLDKLVRDTKAQRFKDKYGTLMAVEVDALDATHPEVLEKLVQKSVDDHYDTGIYKTEILDKYGSKEHKKKVNDMVIERLEAEIVKLRKRSDEDDFEDEELEDEEDEDDADQP